DQRGATINKLPPIQMRSSIKATGRSGICSAFTIPVRNLNPTNVPAIAPTIPNKAPIPNALPVLAAIVAPVKAPITIRAINPGGAVRGPAIASLSATNSPSARIVKIITAGHEPIHENGCTGFNQPTFTAHAVSAGGVSERIPQ